MTTIGPARPADLPALKSLIERAYRGETARLGWTHEADLLEGERITLADLKATVDAPETQMLVARDEDRIVGSVAITKVQPTLSYLGMLAVDPTLQSAGLGRKLLDAGEALARSGGAERLEMTVIDTREELIAWYERRGYRRTGETRPFVIELDPPLAFAVLEKSL